MCVYVYNIHTYKFYIDFCVHKSNFWKDKLIKRGCQLRLCAGMGTQPIGHRHRREFFHCRRFYALCLNHVNILLRKEGREG